MTHSDPNNGGRSEQAHAAAASRSVPSSQPGVSAELESCQAQLNDARREADELRNKYLRAAAEVENTRKQAERDAAIRAAQEKRLLLREFLEVADNLERALALPADSPGLHEGVRLALRQLQQVLSRAGAEPIAAKAGDAFDPVYHEAVEARAGTVPHDTVVDVVTPGYMHGETILRPAQVIVARAGHDGG
jgi:molecular chaperone GrpE